MNRLIYLLAFVLVSGCSSNVERTTETTEVIEKAMPALASGSPPVTGSIYHTRLECAVWFSQEFCLGDIITVVLNESTQAQRSNGINTLKEATILHLANSKQLLVQVCL